MAAPLHAARTGDQGARTTDDRMTFGPRPGIMPGTSHLLAVPDTDHIARIQAFISKWELSGAAERANAHLFIAGLCDL